MIVNTVYGDSTITIYGIKNYDDGTPVIGGLVAIYFTDSTPELLVSKTTTDKYGAWTVEIVNTSLASGHYQIRYYGTGLVPKLPPEGDWELFEIFNDSDSIARTLTLTSTSLVVRQMADGSLVPDVGTGITLTATAQNQTIAANFKWFKNGVDLGLADTATSYFISGANYPTTADTYLVQMYDTLLVAQDSMTIPRLLDGSGSISIILSNEVHAVACNVDGTPLPGEIGSGGRAVTTVYVYYGATPLTAVTGTLTTGDFKISALTCSTGTTAGQTGADVVYVNTMTDAEVGGYIDIEISCMPLSTTQVITKRFSLAKAQPEPGATGAGLVYRGAWSASKSYTATSAIRDVVLRSTHYYYALLSSSGISPKDPLTEGSYWQQFTDEFASVATDLLLAQSATITEALVLGADDGTSKYGKVYSALASGVLDGNGFYMSATASSTAGYFRIGNVSGGALTKGIYWNGPSNQLSIKASNFELTAAGALWADSGGFGGTSAAPALTLNASGLSIKNSLGAPSTYVTGNSAWRYGGPASMAVTTICSGVTGNGNFENVTDMNNWNARGGAVLGTDYGSTIEDKHIAAGTYNPHSGTPGSAKYAFIKANSTTKGFLRSDSTINTHYYTHTIGFWYRIPESDAPVQMTVRCTKDYAATVVWEQVLGEIKDGSGTANEWKYFTKTWKLPAVVTAHDIMFFASGGLAGTYDDYVYIDDVIWTYTTPYVELNGAGLVIANGPNSYIQLGEGKSEIKVDQLNTCNLDVYGTLTVHGGITSNNYYIGGPTGWRVETGYIAKDNGTLSAGMAPNDYPFYAGHPYSTRSTSPFRVTPSGVLYATGANVAGILSAGAGSSIAGWTVQSTEISKPWSYGGATNGRVYMTTSGISDLEMSGGFLIYQQTAVDTEYWSGMVAENTNSAGNKVVFFAGYQKDYFPYNINRAPFYVTTAGYLKATTGAIGPATFDDTAITGGVIRTASSGARVEMSATNGLRIYSTSSFGSQALEWYKTTDVLAQSVGVYIDLGSVLCGYLQTGTTGDKPFSLLATELDISGDTITLHGTMAGAGDVNIYRVSAGVLATDSEFKAKNGGTTAYRVARYRGKGTSNPATDRVEGDFFFNTSVNIMYYYDGSNWQTLG